MQHGEGVEGVGCCGNFGAADLLLSESEVIVEPQHDSEASPVCVHLLDSNPGAVKLPLVPAP